MVFWVLWVGAGLGERNGHLIGDLSSGALWNIWDEKGKLQRATGETQLSGQAARSCLISKLSLPLVHICQLSPSDTPLLDAENTVGMRWMLFFYFLQLLFLLLEFMFHYARWAKYRFKVSFQMELSERNENTVREWATRRASPFRDLSVGDV